eukprot:TRINITY_DN16589_c0_g1_i1.p1 TRINITY_DN16589_c0_g1~~TRINITY_DN16589_c0_g1_i1.p1  ORF type:complete len:752 (+),score=239.54 TRINITY_DN16589_c0_g1_i1:84-2339(+)
MGAATDFTCPICFELLYDPVRPACGHSFCRHCLKTWRSVNDGHLTCPLDRKRVERSPEVDDDLRRKIATAHPFEYESRGVVVTAEKAEQLIGEVRLLATRSCANARLVENLRNLEGQGALRQGSPLETALLQLPRGEFIPPTHRSQAYSTQQPLHIALLQFTVTAAALHVLALNLLDLQPGEAVLDVGTGSGIVAALAAQLVGIRGTVHGTDIRAPVLAFASRNIDVQRSRAAVMAAEQREHAAAEAGPAGALVPGAVFLGAHGSQKVHLLVDSRSGDVLRGRVHWPNRGKTTDFFHATITHAAPPAPIEVTLTEDQVLTTRFVWEQVTWVPSTYAFVFDGTKFEGRGAAAGFNLERVSENALGPAPCFDNISLFKANIFSDKDMRRCLRALPARDGVRLYDKIHCAASCDEEHLVDILKYVRVGGTLVTPVDGSMCVVTRTAEGYEIDRRTRVRYGELLSVEEQRAVEDRDRAEREEREASNTAQSDSVYLSKCCGLPVANRKDLVDVPSLLGGGLDLDDGDGQLFPPDATLSGVTVSADPSFISVTHLGGEVAPARCTQCARTLGFVFKSEPPERAGGEKWTGRVLICSSYLSLGALPDASPHNIVKCANPSCRHPLSRKEQLLSHRHKWKLAGSTKSEASAYMNSLLPDACREGATANTLLAQGRMAVAPLHCAKCDAEVGWKFVSHVCTPQRAKLMFYEGRVGLVASRVTGLPNNEMTMMSRLFLHNILNRTQTAVVLANGLTNGVV